MRYIHLITLAALMLWSLVVAATQVAGAQQSPAGGRPTPPTASSGQAGRIGGAGIGAYPAREPGDPVAIERGRNIYSTNCAFCHGADTRLYSTSATVRRRCESAEVSHVYAT